MAKRRSQNTRAEEPEEIDADPESFRNLIPGNVPLLATVATLLPLAILALLITFAR